MEGHDSRDAIIADAKQIDPDFGWYDGPGKYEAASDRELAAALYTVTLVSGEDDRVGDVSYMGFFARIGRYILEIDNNGFVTFSECESPEDAESAFLKLAGEVDPPEGWC
jgi:hypothetical protein